MCGLAGVFLAPKKRSASELEAIADIFTANLIANEVRGRDATGVAMIRANGEFQIEKAPVPASTFVRSPRYEAALSTLDERVVCLMGHTRLPTQGDPEDNRNNHPIMVGEVVGMHNGYIVNDSALFEHFRFPRAGEVDSEIIFRMLAALTPQQSPLHYMSKVIDHVQLLEGPMAVMAVDLQNPSRLLVIKDGSPLCVHYEPKYEALFFSSRYLFLRKAFGRSVITEALPAPSVMLFDADNLEERVSLRLEREPLPRFMPACCSALAA